MTPQILTLVFVGVIALLIIPIYDIWAATNSTHGDTISNVLASLKRYLPILPYWWGIACGHVFTTAPPALDLTSRWVSLVWSSVVLCLLCWTGHLDVNRRLDVILTLLLGVLMGAFLLSQRHAYTL